MKNKKSIPFFLSKGTYTEMVDKIINLSYSTVSTCVFMANVHTFITAFQDINFANIIGQADIVTPDGMPLTWALRLLYGVKQERICGMDIFPDLVRKAESLKIPVFFYGGTNIMLDRTKGYLSANFPSLILAGTYSPPFRLLNIEEEIDIVQTINKTGAKLVFVILGCPKQEKWMASMRNKIKATMIGIGGALPVTIGIQKRSPLWMQKCGLEWLYRLIQEPKRLFKRYFVTNSIFIFLIAKELVLIKLFKKRRMHINNN
jgi:N-acetylglucosaminyldiphosphoundecaprenol N-acetyl-beta-D-mannosaminyltransferase